MFMILLMLFSSFLIITIFTISDFRSETTKGRDVEITIIYDNYPAYENFQGDWGFSCLIEGKDKTILFDTGTKSEVFSKNLKKLNIDIQSIDFIVISHNHGDHTGGLPVLAEQSVNAPIYIPSSVSDDFIKYFPSFRNQIIVVSDPVEICEGVLLTGEMGERIKEQSLLVETEMGIVVITGCSHPGINIILDKVTEISDQPIHLVMGGFHMLDHSSAEIKKIIDQFKFHQVKQCAPSHCAGDKAKQMFKEAFRENFITLGAGRKIIISNIGQL